MSMTQTDQGQDPTTLSGGDTSGSYDDTYEPESQDSLAGQPDSGSQAYAEDEDEYEVIEDGGGWSIRDDETDAILAGPFESESEAAEYLQSELTDPGSTGQPLEGGGDYSIIQDLTSPEEDVEVDGPFVASRTAMAVNYGPNRTTWRCDNCGKRTTSEENHDNSWETLGLDSDTHDFCSEPCAVEWGKAHRDEVMNSSENWLQSHVGSVREAIYETPNIGERVMVDFLSHLEEGTATAVNDDGKVEITFDDGQVSWYWPDEITLVTPREGSVRTAGLAWYDDTDVPGEEIWAANIGDWQTAFVYGPTAENPGWGWEVQDANHSMAVAEGEGSDKDDCIRQVEQWLGVTGSARTATNWMLDGTPIEGGFEVQGDAVGENAADWRQNPSEDVWESGGMTADGIPIRPAGIWPGAWSEEMEDVEDPTYVNQVAPFLDHPEQI